MVTFDETQDMQNHKLVKHIRAQGRVAARESSRSRDPGGLSELIHALALGLAGIANPWGNGVDRPARPAW